MSIPGAAAAGDLSGPLAMAGELLAACDPDGRLRAVNAAWEACLGWSPDDLHGMALSDLVHPDDRDRWSAATAHSAAEIRLRHEDGGHRWLSWRSAITEDGSLHGCARDVTDRKRMEAALRDTESRLERIAANVPGMMYQFVLRADGTAAFLWVSDGCREIYGLEPADIVANAGTVTGIVHPDDLDAFQSTILVSAERLTPWRWEGRVVLASGEEKWLQGAARPERLPGGDVLWDGLLVDQSELRRAQDERRELRGLLEGILDNADAVVFAKDLDGRYLFVNRRYEQVHGIRNGALIGRTDWDVHPAPLAEAVRRNDAAVLARSGPLTVEERVPTIDGDRVFLSTKFPLPGSDGEARGVCGVAIDITERTRLQERLEHLADHDSLTGLFNRRRFEAELTRQLDTCRTTSERAALLLIDVDHFKFVNDTFGHLEGDRILVATADALVGRLRDDDLVARMGGDEFAVLLRNVDAPQAQRVAEDLVRAIRERHSIDGTMRPAVTVSIGVAPLKASHHDLTEPLIDADLGLYAAKDAGRDCARCACMVPAGRAGMVTSMGAITQIRDALQHDGFVLHAQPVVDISTGAAVHHELLLRMRGPDGGLISPGEFLPHAERFGLMPAIDRWVIGAAVRLLAQRTAGTLAPTFAINLSGRTIGDATLTRDVERLLADHGVDGSRLIFEITETEAIADLQHAIAFAEAMRRLGCRLALDDFGSGFAGFTYLKRLPFDMVKIDGEFVQGLGQDTTDRLVVDALVGIAHGLGMAVVAEFVSDAERLRLVRDAGVDLVQGYHLGRPEPL